MKRKITRPRTVIHDGMEIARVDKETGNVLFRGAERSSLYFFKDIKKLAKFLNQYVEWREQNE